MLNDGTGHFTLDQDSTPNDTPSTLGIAVGDINGDGRLDLVQAQGESAFPDKLQLATTAVEADTRGPTVVIHVEDTGGPSRLVSARVIDLQGPAHPQDMERVWVEIQQASETGPDLDWYGEFLWRASIETGFPLTHPLTVRVCARDRSGNQGCSDYAEIPVGAIDDIGGSDVTHPGGSSGGCCDAGHSPSNALMSGALVLMLVRRRRRH